MKERKSTRKRNAEAGIALLISIFILLLISVVAIALIVSSGTETALAGNYRSSTAVYYAALSGLEEARSRLMAKNPNSFKNTAPANFLPSPMPIGSIAYVLNPSPDPSFNENAGNLLALYPDTEYDNEFGAGSLAAANTAGTVTTTSSVWNRAPLNAVNGTMAGPFFKWVRINPVSEVVLNLDVSPFDGTKDPLKPIFFDGANLNDINNGQQVLEVTSLAFLPNGSQKILQYLVVPTMNINLVFPAALTLDGFSDAFSGPDHHFFQVTGNQDGGDAACGGPTMPYPVPAIGVPDQNPDVNYVISGNPGPGSTGIPASQTANYTGSGPAPNVAQVALAPSLQTVQSLNQLVQAIIQSADLVIQGPATQANLPAIDPSNPMTIVIQGDPTVPSQGNLTLSGFTGYGLLLVTGSLQYTPDVNWNGIVLVIGQGSVATINGAGGGIFTGAMLIAQTRDSSGNLLAGPSPGRATYNDSSTLNVGRGFFYNCSWIQAARPTSSYKVLSFHEIPQ